MATMAAVDLGAQSGRVAVGRFDGERLDVNGSHRFPNGPVQVARHAALGRARLYREVLDGLRAAGADAERIDSVGVDSWGVDFGLLDRRGRLVGNPVHYRDQRRAGRVRVVLARVPARELYERTGIQILPINTVFELAAMAAEGDPALEARRDAADDPRPAALLARGVAGRRVDERDHDAVPRRAHRRLGRRPPRAGSASRRACCPSSSSPGRRSARSRRTSPTRPGSATPTVVAVGTHDTASAVAAVPFRTPARPTSAPARGRSSASRSPEPLITDEHLRREPDERGRRRRHVPAAAQRHRALAAARVPPRLGERRARATRSRSSSRSPRTRRRFARSSTPTTRSFAAPGDMPARHPRFCAAHRPAAARRRRPRSRAASSRASR